MYVCKSSSSHIFTLLKLLPVSSKGSPLAIRMFFYRLCHILHRMPVLASHPLGSCAPASFSVKSRLQVKCQSRVQCECQEYPYSARTFGSFIIRNICWWLLILKFFRAIFALKNFKISNHQDVSRAFSILHYKANLFL